MLKLLFNSIHIINCLLMILFYKLRENSKITLRKKEKTYIKIKRECVMSIEKYDGLTFCYLCLSIPTAFL